MEQIATLEVQNLCKRFGSNEVLKGINLTANKGDVVSIIGSSGSGKSTFLRCINLLETPTSGDVYVHGELIRMKSDKRGLSLINYRNYEDLKIDFIKILILFIKSIFKSS